jgi:ABC-type Fe3+-siderophore transport system permease subunit
MPRLLQIALLAGLATRLAAQQLPPVIPTLSKLAAPSVPPPFGHPDDYRLEGLIAGAALIGGAVTLLAVALCAQADECDTADVVLISLGSIALGGLTGALIGGAIPKAPRPSSSQASLWLRASNERLLLTGAMAGGRYALLARLSRNQDSLLLVRSAPAAEPLIR